MRCSNCASENPADSAFCEQCGRKLELLCPACKAPLSSGARFCKRCGASLSAAAAPSQQLATKSPPGAEMRLLVEPAAADLSGGERKTVTALFADLKGSTELMRDLDPEEARAIIDPALRLMIDAVHRYDGYVVQSTGDGIFALFGAPAAYEDHPQRALYAALQIQDELRKYGTWRAHEDHRLKPVPVRKEDRLNPVPLEARVGVNTGEVVRTSRDRRKN
jgi:class 3 adenylate cyclase